MLFQLLTIAALALGGTTQTIHDCALETIADGATGGTLITTGALNATQYTGWFFVGNMKQILLDTTYVYNSASAVSMVCYGAFNDAGANGTGARLQETTKTGTAAAPIFTTGPATWTKAVGANAHWPWLVDNNIHPWVNCAFSSTGGAAADTATVVVCGVSP